MKSDNTLESGIYREAGSQVRCEPSEQETYTRKQYAGVCGQSTHAHASMVTCWPREPSVITADE